MAVASKKVKLTLVGLDSNAFNLMGKFQKAARAQGFSKEYVDDVLNKCMLSDYNNLLRVMMEHCEDE
jgi:hypothetical protein